MISKLNPRKIELYKEIISWDTEFADLKSSNDPRFGEWNKKYKEYLLELKNTPTWISEPSPEPPPKCDTCRGTGVCVCLGGWDSFECRSCKGTGRKS